MKQSPYFPFLFQSPRYTLHILIVVILVNLAGCSHQPTNEPYAGKTRSAYTNSLPHTPRTFSKAKKLLYNTIYKNHQRTFYCNCTFTKSHRVYLGSCNTLARKNRNRAKRLEAEHVFPAHHFGQHRACWHKKLCVGRNGKAFGGRKCCDRIDPSFRTAHNDLHNLYPSSGEINGDRSNYKFGEIRGEKREYGQCNFEIDHLNNRAEPPDNVKGNIARTYLYMAETYHIRLSKQQKRLFKVWNLIDPVDDWERERNRRIAKIQGNRNHFIQ